jgi:hypothetical protein
MSDKFNKPDDAINISNIIGSSISKNYVDSNIYGTAVNNEALKVAGKLVIEDLDGNNKIDVGETLKSISERLCVLQPDFEAHEHYPALKDAYEQYKMLEKLLLDSNVKKD